MSKYPNVGEVWIDDDFEQCEIVKIANGRVWFKFLNNIADRKDEIEPIDVKYFLMSWKHSEVCRVTQILSKYGKPGN